MEESDHRRRRWVLAASELVKNPAAKVRCPDCGTFLSTEGEKVGASHVDLHIFCTNWARANTS